MPRGDGTGPGGNINGKGQGRGGRFSGPGGLCVCPGCGEKVKHIQGQPCNQQKCPKCGTMMTRESNIH